jgi:hypothetical protein
MHDIFRNANCLGSLALNMDFGPDKSSALGKAIRLTGKNELRDLGICGQADSWYNPVKTR